MRSNGNGIEFRDYIRVVFARCWWILFITIAVTGGMFFYTFQKAGKSYAARNVILVTNKFSGAIAKDIGAASDWFARVRQVELDLKRNLPAQAVVEDAAAAVGQELSPDKKARMVESFKDDMKVVYTKEGDFINLEYRAGDAELAAAVLSLFIKRMIASCIGLQMEELNNEVRTLMTLRTNLEAEVAAAERELDQMKTVAPELRLTASTMALLRSGQNLTTLPSTEQAVGVFLELQRDVITLDGQIADLCEQIEQTRRTLAEEPSVVASKRKLETLPAVREATKKRDDLRLQLAGLLSNSTAEHPLVKKIQAELKSLDAFLASAATEATVEIVYEANVARQELEAKLTGLESELGGLGKRRAKMEDNAAEWRAKLDEMPAALRIVREATLDYEKKAQNLSLITDRLVQAQIKRSLELDQVGTYYRPEVDPTSVPAKYDKPKHVYHLLMGIVLGLVAGVFVVYALEFADHSVKDQRDIQMYSKAAVLGVISDYNQLKAVASRGAWTKAAGLRQYLLAALFIACSSVLAWAYWRNMPEPRAGKLPESLSSATVANIAEAMQLYNSGADMELYRAAPEASVDVLPAVTVPAPEIPEPVLSE